MRSLLVLLFLCSAAQAQTTTYYNQYQMQSGYSRPTGNTTYYYNNTGQQAFSTRQDGTTTQYFDNANRQFGSTRTTPGIGENHLPVDRSMVRDQYAPSNPNRFNEPGYSQYQRMQDIRNAQLREAWIRQYGRRW